MGTQDKASNKVQDVKGQMKEKVGKAVGDKDLESEGTRDQAVSGVKDVGEEVKDAASKVSHAVKGDR